MHKHFLNRRHIGLRHFLKLIKTRDYTAISLPHNLWSFCLFSRLSVLSEDFMFCEYCFFFSNFICKSVNVLSQFSQKQIQCLLKVIISSSPWYRNMRSQMNLNLITAIFADWASACILRKVESTFQLSLKVKNTDWKLHLEHQLFILKFWKFVLHV